MGEVPTTSSVAILTPMVTPLNEWLETATWGKIAWVLGRVMYLLIAAYHENILLGDCKVPNWGITVASTRLTPTIKMIDLGGLQVG